MGEKKKKKKKKEVKKPLFSLILPRETKRMLEGTVVFILAIITGLSFFGKAGVAGEKFNVLITSLIGKTALILPFALVGIGLIILTQKYKKFLKVFLVAISIFILGIAGTLASFYPNFKKGGWLGYFLSFFVSKLFGILVAKIIFFIFILIGFLIFWQLLISPFLKEKRSEEPFVQKALEPKKKRKSIFTRIFKTPKFKIKKVPPLPSEETSGVASTKTIPPVKTEGLAQKPLTSKYQLPPLDLLEKEKEKPSAGDTRAKSTLIKKTLENFDIPVEMAGINIGPTVTQYTLKPAEGIKLSRITALSNNLSLALAAHPIRIEAPIPGQSLVGIEVPNKVRARVRLKNLIAESAFQKASSNLTFSLGKDVSGKPLYADLSKMPHLLVAGATGTGKTIFLNSLILSLLYKNSPEILRLILIDPKRVEFTAYNNKLPHLLCPVIYDAPKTVNCLQWLISEMGNRFDRLSLKKVRDINSYNEKMLKEKEELMPYIILIIDELADLIIAKGKEIETGIVRLAQLARAVGIHLVVATQRPSVEVITGLIKANITSRISFQVASQVDSRTILDMAGAEKLLGLGDMLYLSARIIKPKRIQGAYVSEKEFKKIVNWIAEENKEAYPEDGLATGLQEALEGTQGEISKPFQDTPKDSLYPEAKRVVIEEGRGSASLLQRKLRIGYARAARLIDMLEERGIVGPHRGPRARKVYLDGQEDEEVNEEDFPSDYDQDLS